MGIEAVALSVLAAASGYQAYESKAAATDTKKAAKKQEYKADALRQEEDRNRLQTVMRTQKRSGSRLPESTALTSPLANPVGGGKTLLGS